MIRSYLCSELLYSCFYRKFIVRFFYTERLLYISHENIGKHFMKNTDPTVKRLNRSTKLIGVFLAVALIGFTLIFISNRFGPSKDALPTSYYVIEMGLILFSALLSLASIIFTRRVYRKAEQQRTAAIQGDISGKIAEEQPITNTLTLTLPVTLAVRANWRFLVSFILLTFCLGLILASLIFYYYFLFRKIPLFSGMPTSLLLVVIGGAILFSLIVMSVTLLISARRLRQYIQVSEDGIQGRFLGQESSIRWDEIKLFALWGGKSKSMRAYEIAGTTSMVRWTIPIKKHWYNPLVPTQPFEEYDKQMQAVLALIATKTQLPLYDLRLKWWGGALKQY